MYSILNLSLIQIFVMSFALEATLAKDPIWPALKEPIESDSPEVRDSWSLLNFTRGPLPVEWSSRQPDELSPRFRENADSLIVGVEHYLGTVSNLNPAGKIVPLPMGATRMQMGEDFLKWASATFDQILAMRARDRMTDLDVIRIPTLVDVISNRMKDADYARAIASDPVLRNVVFNLIAQGYSVDPRAAKILFQPFYENSHFWNVNTRAMALRELTPRGSRAVLLPPVEFWKGDKIPEALMKTITEDLQRLANWFSGPASDRVGSEEIEPQYIRLESVMLSLARARTIGYKLPVVGTFRTSLEQLRSLKPRIMELVQALERDRSQQAKNEFGDPSGDTDEERLSFMASTDGARFNQFYENFPRMLDDLLSSGCRQRVSRIKRRS